MADPRAIKRSLLQDLMQRARASSHSGSGVKFLSAGPINSTLRGSRSSSKSPRTKSPKHKHYLHLPSVFKLNKETLSPGDTSKSGSLKENSAKRGSRFKRSKSPVGDQIAQQKTPITKQQEVELEEKRNKALHQKVLQLIKERRSTPGSKRNPAQAREEEFKTHHVLYTTFEDDSLKQALNSEPISVIPWKSGKSVPSSPGRNLTKVSYCTSCGHIDESHENATTANPPAETNIPTQTDSTPTTTLSSLVEETTNITPEKRSKEEDQDKAISHARSPKILVTQSSEAEELIGWKPEHRSRCNSLPASPRNPDPEVILLEQEIRVVKQARIKRSSSLQRKTHLVRRHTEPYFDLQDPARLVRWRAQLKYSATETDSFGIVKRVSELKKNSIFTDNCSDSDKYITYTTTSCTSRHSSIISTASNGKSMMPKLKNGTAGDFYPLLKTKIPEEQVEEDGSVTFRKAGQGGSLKHAEVDRDSGVDIDSKAPSQANSNDSDFEYDHETTMTPDSVLEPSKKNGPEFDFDTLKRSKVTQAEDVTKEDGKEENSQTLTRHSTISEESTDDKWDMYALLKRFEFVEWELKPADNLKRQTLDLDSCNLDCVPAAVTEIEYYAFRDVEAVSLNHNEKIENADVLGKLADLRIINMWGCNLKSIPQTWARLTKLQMLGLGNNKNLTDFGPLKHLTNIIWLDLGGCGLKRIPDEVTNMMKLKVLALGGNVGIDIGDEICSLWDLKKLGLNDCGLEEIPKSVFSLVKLTHLHLDNNYICNIDQEIVQLTDLVELTVTGNDDISFPKLLSQCDTIKCIVVDEAKDLSRISGTLKSRMKTMPTAMSPVRHPNMQNRRMSLT